MLLHGIIQKNYYRRYYNKDGPPASLSPPVMILLLALTDYTKKRNIDKPRLYYNSIGDDTDTIIVVVNKRLPLHARITAYYPVSDEDYDDDLKSTYHDAESKLEIQNGMGRMGGLLYLYGQITIPASQMTEWTGTVCPALLKSMNHFADAAGIFPDSL